MISAASSGRDNLVGGYDCLTRNDLNACASLLDEITHLEQELGHLPKGWQYHWNRVQVPPPVPPRDSTWSPIIQTTPSLYARYDFQYQLILLYTYTIPIMYIPMLCTYQVMNFR